MAGINLSESQGQGTSQGQSFGQQGSSQASQSSSTSFIPNYSQTPILESIAQYAENMAPQVYQWGMQQWGNNQQNINDLMRTADTYASGQRLATDVGMAEAGVQQGGEQALQANKADLESYGIDPSSGRYAALDQASRVQTAAAAAGAGNQQRMADIATGNALKNQAISADLQNSAYGNQVSDTMNNLLSTGIRLPYSPLGSEAQATSSGYSYGMNESTNASQNSNASDSIGLNYDMSGAGGAGGGPSGGGGGGGVKGPSNQGGGGGGPGGGGTGDYSVPGGGPSNSGPGKVGGMGGGVGGDSGSTYPAGSIFNVNDPSGLGIGFTGDSTTLPYDSPYYDPYSAYNDPSITGIDPSTQTDPYSTDGGGSNPWGGAFTPDTGGGDWSNPTTFTGDTWTGGGDTGGGGGDMTSFAEGGPVDDDFDSDQQQAVDPSMSPSGGSKVDDVRAKLNSGEFVVPEDVARWKGEEFLQNLIAKSRQARQSVMAAHGQMQRGDGMNLGGAI